MDLTNNTNSGLLPFLILFSSLIGSWHCAGMCGPLVTSAGLHHRAGLYHLGRMLSYVSLGAVAGFSGQSLFALPIRSIQLTSGLLMAFILISLGVSYTVGWTLPKFPWTAALIKGMRKYREQAFLLGLLTGLLPCGWLYSFVFAAAATKSLTMGMMVMFIFWVGTVPALSFLSSGMNSLLKTTPRRIKTTIGVLFIAAGIYSLWIHLFFEH